MDALRFVEDEKYYEVLQLRENLSYGGRCKKVYMLTQEAFKNVWWELKDVISQNYLMQRWLSFELI